MEGTWSPRYGANSLSGDAAEQGAVAVVTLLNKETEVRRAASSREEDPEFERSKVKSGPASQRPPGRGPEREATGGEGPLLRIIALGSTLLLFFGGKREAE